MIDATFIRLEIQAMSDAALKACILRDAGQHLMGVAQRSDTLRLWLDEERAECLRRGRERIWTEAVTEARRLRAEEAQRDREPWPVKARTA